MKTSVVIYKGISKEICLEKTIDTMEWEVLNKYQNDDTIIPINFIDTYVLNFSSVF